MPTDRAHRNIRGNRRTSTAYTAPLAPTADEKLQREVAGATTQIHNFAAPLEVQRGNDVGRTLPRVTLCFDDIQLTQGVYRSIGGV